MLIWRFEILVPLLMASSVVARGWWRLSRRASRWALPWQPALVFAGLASVAAALLSPLDRLAHVLFSAHMVQHTLLVMVAPPLVLLADPLPLFLWGLPGGVRRRVGQLLAPGALARQLWRRLTWMPVAWLAYAMTLWLWHLPAMYEAALEDRFLHDLEHLAFFGTGLLFWWPIVNPAPRLHGRGRHVLRIIYVLLGEGQHALLGLLLSMSSEVLYPFYLRAPNPLEDQAWGGVIMWGTGGVAGLITVIVLLFSLLEREEQMSVPVGARESFRQR